MHSRVFAVVAVTLAPVIALVSGCRSGNLPKSQARDLIQQDKGASEVLSVDFYTGKVYDYQDFEPYVSLGLIETPVPVRVGNWSYSSVVLTPKGKQAAQGWANWGYTFGASQRWRVPVSSGRSVVEVTSIITKPELKEATAEFSWQWQYNEIGL